MSGFMKKWFNKVRSSASSESHDSRTPSDNNNNAKKPESKVDPVDPGDKRKHEHTRDSGDEDQLQMTPLDKKRRLNSVVSKSTTDMTSTPVQNGVLKEGGSKLNVNVSFLSKYNNSKFKSTSPSVPNDLSSFSNAPNTDNVVRQQRSKLRRAQSMKGNHNATVLKSQAACNELQIWLDELEMKKRTIKGTSGSKTPTTPTLPVSPRHSNMMTRKPGSPYSRPNSRMARSPARTPAQALTPTHRGRRASNLVMRQSFSPSAQNPTNPTGARDLRKQMIQLENLVPSLKEKDVETRKLSEEIKLAPAKTASPAVLAQQQLTPKKSNTPKRPPIRPHSSPPKAAARPVEDKVSDTTIVVKSKEETQPRMGEIFVTDGARSSITVQSEDDTDSVGSYEIDFQSEFGNFSIQAPYDVTPASSRMHTQPHTPRRQPIRVRERQTITRQKLTEVVQKLDKSPDMAKPSFTERLIANSQNQTPERQPSPVRATNKSPARVPDIHPENPPDLSSLPVLHQPPKQTAPQSLSLADMMKLQKPGSLMDQFSKKSSAKSTYECDGCMCPVDLSKAKCPACETPNPNYKPSGSESSTKPAAAAPAKPTFSFGAAVTPSALPPLSASTLPPLSGSLLMKNSSKSTYDCSGCFSQCPVSVKKCPACEEPNPNYKEPAGSSGGASSGASQKNDSNKPTFSFGVTASESKSTSSGPTFSFGAGDKAKTDTDSKPAPTFSFGAPATKASSDSPAKSTPTFSFGTGASKTDESNAPAPSFSFGAKPAEPEKKNEKPAPTFSFGAAAPKAEEPAAKAPTFSFGGAAKPVEEPATKAPAFSFGGSAKPAGEPAAKAPAFSFGAKPAEQKPAETGTPFSFGAKPAEPAKTAPSFSFGKRKADDDQPKAAAPAAPFAFGGTPSKQPPSNTPFTFGSGTTSGSSGATTTTTPSSAATSSSATTASSGFTFGASTEKKQDIQPAAPAFNFGAAAKPEAPTRGAPFQFSTSSTPQNDNPAASPFNFGSAVKTDVPSSGSPFTFGKAPAAPTSGSNTPFQFAKPAEAPKSESLFGNSSAAPPTTAAPFSFGQASTSSMSTSQMSTGANASTSAPFSFGKPAQPATSAPTSSPFNFAAPAVSSSNTPFAFGNPASTSVAAPTSNAPFAFGGPSQAPAAPNQQPAAPSFNFGGNAPAPAAGGANPFGFQGGNANANLFNPAAANPNRPMKKAVRRRKK